MKLVTKQELLNYPEGTYYTQFRDKKFLLLEILKKLESITIFKFYSFHTF